MTGPETEAADSAAAAQALLALIPDWVLAYGDSPALSGFVPPEVRRSWLGYVVYFPGELLPGQPRFVWGGTPTPQWLLALLERHRSKGTYIYQLECAAAASPYFSLPAEWFEGRTVWHYIDNQPACYGFIRGGAKCADASRLILLTLLRAARLACRPWFDYVDTESNYADVPTRPNLRDIAALLALGPQWPLRLPSEEELDCAWSHLSHLI